MSTNNNPSQPPIPDDTPRTETAVEIVDSMVEGTSATADVKTQPAEKVTQPPRPAQEREVEGIVFEPLIQNPYDLTYTCLLIPRFPTHYLVGDVVNALNEYMSFTCMSYGWRLNDISTKSDYVQWVISVPPATSIGRFMNIIRRQTSSSIFEDFPRFSRLNKGGDFWAPGYLISAGSQLHSQIAIREFIRETRRQQGVYSK